MLVREPVETQGGEKPRPYLEVRIGGKPVGKDIGERAPREGYGELPSRCNGLRCEGCAKACGRVRLEQCPRHVPERDRIV